MSPFGSGTVLNAGGHEDRRAVEGGPRLPPLVLEAEHRPRIPQRRHVHAEGVLQVRGDLAEQLVRLDDADRRARLVQPQRLPQPRDAADVHARHRAGPKVQRHAIGLLVIQCRLDALARIHDLFPGPWVEVGGPPIPSEEGRGEGNCRRLIHLVPRSPQLSLIGLCRRPFVKGRGRRMKAGRRPRMNTDETQIRTDNCFLSVFHLCSIRGSLCSFRLHPTRYTAAGAGPFRCSGPARAGNRREWCGRRCRTPDAARLRRCRCPTPRPIDIRRDARRPGR